jgi:hypothetical protein
MEKEKRRSQISFKNSRIKPKSQISDDPSKKSDYSRG